MSCSLFLDSELYSSGFARTEISEVVPHAEITKGEHTTHSCTATDTVLCRPFSCHSMARSLNHCAGTPSSSILQCHLRRYCNACFVVPQVHSPHAVVEVLITVKGVTHEQPIFVSQFTIQQMLEFVGRKCWVSGDQLTEDRPDTPCAVQIYPSLEYSKVPWYPHCAVLRRSHIRSESSSHTSCQRLRLSHLRQDGQFCRRNRIWLNLTQSLTSLINLTH